MIVLDMQWGKSVDCSWIFSVKGLLTKQNDLYLIVNQHRNNMRAQSRHTVEAVPSILREIVNMSKKKFRHTNDT